MVDAVVFDLDDTLLAHTGKVPKQTFHLLKKLVKSDVKLAVISANPLARYFVRAAGLGRYVTVVVEEIDVQEGKSNPLRRRQFSKALELLRVDLQSSAVMYVDDGKRHLATIKKAFPRVRTYWCESPYVLHKLHKHIC